MQCNKENYQVAQPPTPIPAPFVFVFFLYLNAFHFYVAELEQTHSRVRKASQVKERRESQVAPRNFIERDQVDDEQRTRSDLPASPFLLFLSPSLPSSCLLLLHCMLVILKGFWGHDCAACCCLLFFYHLKST